MSGVQYISHSDHRIPNIVVDGRPNAATVLSLSHWKGTPTPPQLWANTSTGIALNWVATRQRPPAPRVTNDHFDADGLLAAWTVIHPDEALEHRSLIADAADTGDFDVVRNRRAARLAWTIAAVETRRTKEMPKGLGVQEVTDKLYTSMLASLTGMFDEESCRSLWVGADKAFDESMRLIDSKRVRIEEHPGDELAVFHYDADDLNLSVDARHTSTLLFRTVEVWPGGHFCYRDRYETWVRYHTRRPLLRVDMRTLAAELSGAEPHGVMWEADSPEAITPRLRPLAQTRSDLSTDKVVARLLSHLRTAPVAWDPYL